MKMRAVSLYPVQKRRRLFAFVLVIQMGSTLALAQNQTLPSIPPARNPFTNGVTEILERAGSLSDPDNRRQAVDAIRSFQTERKLAGEKWAKARNLPLRTELPDRRVREIAGVDENGNPIYLITHNNMAAISTGASVLNQTPYTLSGSSLTIGLWDAGSARSTHQEFTSNRLTVLDGSSPAAHSTHVGGTLAAAGVSNAAKGMAFAANVDSYDWTSDKSEMTARGASLPNESGKIYLSNHSYGFIAGWYRTGGTSPSFIWYGSGTNASAIDPYFGQYNTEARDSDSIAYNAPYYLMFRSAGNDRSDTPSSGNTVQLSPSSTATVTYDPAIHPAADNLYRNGYDTLSFDSVAKNVITIGSTADAVTSGLRDPAKALISGFSAWGPTDDGRIKPDIVANGDSLYSTLSDSDTNYGRMSGTSMATPNATGTAALLIEEYRRLFPGGAMRSSTLKGLLIHTADDLGNAGPDYQYGWGLIHAQAAVEVIRDHAARPEKNRIIEAQLTTTNTSKTYEFVWDGTTPIRATLCWTDPTGSATTSSDLRSPRLRNNIDLKLTGPSGQLYYPFVMPFTRSWTTQDLSAAAVTGTNNTDNVEQVLIAAPPAPGVYRVIITFQGTLTDSKQNFSLFINGSSGETPPPPPLRIHSVSPNSAYSDSTITMTVTGDSLTSVNNLKLIRQGFSDISATNLRFSGSSLLGDFNLASTATGRWTVQISNSNQTALLTNALLITGSLWSENFDGTVSGWTSSVLNSQGTNQWTISTAQAHTPPKAYFARAPASVSTTALTSPGIAIPSNATNLQLRFRHSFDLQSAKDGGRLEFRINGGTWTGVDETNSGAAFASNGYSTQINTPGNQNSRSYFHGKYAWTGNSSGFIETVLNLTNNTKFSGKTVEFRWILATDKFTSSPGWYIDSLVLLGGSDLANQPPQITQSILVAGAESIIESNETIRLVRDNQASLSISATDDGGATNLTFSWTSTGPEPVFFYPDGTLQASNTEAYFEAPGDYILTVSATDREGLVATDSARLRILETPVSVRTDPQAVTLRSGESLQFTATLLDQFNQPVSSQPPAFSWNATGGGTVNSNGLFHAATTGENFSVSAAYNGLSGFSMLTILPGLANIQLYNLNALYDGLPKEASASTMPAGLPVHITYNNASEPPVFAGTYAVSATITDPNYTGTTNGTLVISYDMQEFNNWIAQYDLLPAEAGPDADPDSDGMPNWLEWRFGFDPADPASCLTIHVEPTDSPLQLIINRAIQEGVFDIRSTTSLTEDWNSVTQFRPTQSETNLPVAIPADEPRQFFRVFFLPDEP